MAIRPFIDTLREFEVGTLLEDLSVLQNQMVAAVLETHLGGEITIKLKYVLDGHMVRVRAHVGKKFPELPRGATLFFPTPENNLERNDRNPGNLDLRSVDDPSHPDTAQES